MNLLTTPVLYGLGAATLLAAAGAGVQTIRLSAEKAAHQETKQHHAEQAIRVAQLAQEAEALARIAERAHIDAMAAAGAQYEKDKAHAIATQDRVIADLRSGNLRLRQQWQGCIAASPMPAARSDPVGPQDTADLRATGAGDLVRIAAECDAQVTALQSITNADRGIK